MPMPVARVFTVAIFLVVGVFLSPATQSTFAEKPAKKDKKPSRPAMAALPDDLKIIEDISYREGKSKAWKLDLIMPKVKGNKKRPALVFVHGGGWRGGDKRRGFFYSGAIKFAKKGYVCISVNYRLTSEAPFPACVEDVKCAVR